MTNAATFRRLALALPGTSEHPHFDRRAFKARVTFATLAPDGLSVNFKFTPDEQALKCKVHPEGFAAIPNAWGRQGWTTGTLDKLTEADLADALRIAHAHAGPKPKAARRSNESKAGRRRSRPAGKG